jgi:hypothetical protein
MLGFGLLFTSQTWAVFEFESPVNPGGLSGGDAGGQSTISVPMISGSSPGAVLFAAPMAGPLAADIVNGTDSFEPPPYNSLANRTIIGLPTPGTEQGWNGPWQNNSSYNASNSKFVSSDDRAYEGSRSLRLTDNSTPSSGFIEADRPTKNALNGGVGYAGYTIDTYIFIPANVVNAQTKVYFAAYTTSQLGGTQSASLSTGASGNSVNWFVWDNGSYRDTGIAVTANTGTWTKLTLDLNMTAKTYNAYLDGVPVLSGQSLAFGAGSSTNLYGVGYAFNNTASQSRSVYFDALGIRSRVPEVPSWLALAGFLTAGLLPVYWRSRRS